MKKHWITGILFVAMAAFSLQSRASSSYGYEEKSSLNFEQLKEHIENQDIRSIEEFLSSFKSRAPQFFENYVLMYRSKSLQRAHFLAPRVLLRDNSAQLIITFNGDPQDEVGFKNLELVQFREDQNRFEFREISFAEGKRAHFSGPNPSKCLECHQSPSRTEIDPRPNWEPYNSWPGAYGSASGRLNRLSHHDKLRLGDEDAQHIQDQAMEEEMLLRFITEIQPYDPRYKHLVIPHAKPKVAARKIAHETVDLTEHLSILNFRRMIRILKEDLAQHWAYTKYTFAGLVRCGSLFLTKDQRQWHRQRVPDEFIGKEAKVRTEPYTRSELRQEVMGGPSLNMTEAEFQNYYESHRKNWKPPQYPPLTQSEGIWLLYEPLGISIEDWGMDFQTQGRFAFRERFGTPSSVKGSLSFALKKMAPDLTRMKCDELEKLSLSKMSEYHRSNLKQESLLAKEQLESSREPLIQRCISCHSDPSSSSIPRIPFEDPFLLQQYLLTETLSGRNGLDEAVYRLSDHATLEDQMPKGLGRPSWKERKALVDYLKSLVQ